MYAYPDVLHRFQPEEFIPKELGSTTFNALARANRPLVLHPGASSEWRSLYLPELHRSEVKFWDILALKHTTESTLDIDGENIIDAVGCHCGSGRIVEAVMLKDNNWTQKNPINAQYQFRTWPTGHNLNHGKYEQKPIVIANLPFTSTKEKWLESRQVLIEEMKIISSIFNGPESKPDIGNFILKGSAKLLSNRLRRIKQAGGVWDRDPWKLRFIFS